MKGKSVALIDVQSTHVTAVIAERGVNDTFIIKGYKTEYYDGYAEGEFFDLPKLKRALLYALNEVEQNSSLVVDSIYVGVPGEFVRLETNKYLQSFQRRRKITSEDIKALYAGGFRKSLVGYKLIRQSCVYFTTSDKRRSVNPVGLVSDSVEGYLSYFLVKDYFINIFDSILKERGIQQINYLPTCLAEALYLIPSEQRDETAILLDVGYISSTISVVCGNGIIYQSSFSEGGGHIVAHMCDDFDIPFDCADGLLKKVNLSANVTDEDDTEFELNGKIASVRSADLNDCVREALEDICERIHFCLESMRIKEIEYNPILLTNTGITCIRGVMQFITGKIDKIVEPIEPPMPFFSKKTGVSVLSLLDMALEDNKKQGLMYKILNGFGG